MSAIPESLDRLTQIAHELEQRGESSIPRQIEGEAATLRAETAPSDLMTPEEAARALGIRSVGHLKRWAMDGRLEGYLQDRRILVSVRSVAALAGSPLVTRQIASECELDEALAPFTFDDIDESEFGDTWVGRKPWAVSDSD